MCMHNPNFLQKREVKSAVIIAIMIFVVTDTQQYFFNYQLMSYAMCRAILYIFMFFHTLISMYIGKPYEPKVIFWVYDLVDYLVGNNRNDCKIGKEQSVKQKKKKVKT